PAERRGRSRRVAVANRGRGQREIVRAAAHAVPRGPRRLGRAAPGAARPAPRGAFDETVAQALGRLSGSRRCNGRVSPEEAGRMSKTADAQKATTQIAANTTHVVVSFSGIF